MKKVTLILLALLLLTVIATAAMAFGPGRGPGMGMGCPVGYDAAVYAALNLSGDQITKINALREAHWKEIAPLREQMAAGRNALRNLWLEVSPDQAKIATAQKELRTLRDQMQDKKTVFRLEKLKILTPEQRGKMVFFGDERGRRGAGMWGGADCCPGW